jgi:hypothetical protein
MLYLLTKLLFKEFDRNFNLIMESSREQALRYLKEYDKKTNSRLNIYGK